MREILFRGKLLEDDKWVYGGFHKHLSITPSPVDPREKIYDYLIFGSGFSDWDLPKPLLTYKVKPETAGQYIGLDDSNGLKIFEGDIVCYWTKHRHVYHMPERIVVTFDYACMQQLSEIKYKEVVGNIYDNPDLLSDEGFIKFKNGSYINALPVQGMAKRGCVYDGFDGFDDGLENGGETN